MNIIKKYFINSPIIQFSPPRTGSTLLCNILRHEVPRRLVMKTHELKAKYLKESNKAKIINQDVRRMCFSNYGLEVVAQKAKALGGFENIDLKDQIHGKHISNFKGRIGHGRENLSPKQVDLINESFRPYSEAFGYLDL